MNYFESEGSIQKNLLRGIQVVLVCMAMLAVIGCGGSGGSGGSGGGGGNTTYTLGGTLGGLVAGAKKVCWHEALRNSTGSSGAQPTVL